MPIEGAIAAQLQRRTESGPVLFKAKGEHQASLKRGWSTWSTTTKIIAVVGFVFVGLYQLFKWLLSPFNYLVKRAVLPAITIGRDQVNKLNSDFALSEHFYYERRTIITPDDVKLNVILATPKTGKADSTVIRFNGNYELSCSAAGSQIPLMDESIKRGKPTNFVFFDYRETGDSQGTFTNIKDLYVDGATVVEWVEKELKTPPSQIGFVGFSLGGLVAANVQALDPAKFTGPHVNISSFTSISDVVDRHTRGLLGFVPKTCGYDGSSEGPINRIKGNPLIVWDERDQIIPPGARLHQKCHQFSETQLYRRSEEAAPYHGPFIRTDKDLKKVADALFGEVVTPHQENPKPPESSSCAIL